MITLGHNIFRGKTTPITIAPQDRLRHMYMIGKTGVGKSTLFQSMALQDIENRNGVCFIDPHGESVQWLLERIPENRLEDIIYFNPSDAGHPFGLNLLEAKTENEKDFLVAECIQIFYKLFDPNKTGIIGPQFEHWLRNAALTVMSGPEGGTLLEIPKLFVDKRFELHKRKYIKDPLVLEFWTKQMAQTADFHKSEMLNYFTSKFGHFLNNALMRNMLGQRVSSFSFDAILSGEKILLVDLSKGKLGELNAYMLGLILIAKLQAAVLARAKLPQEKRYPLYLYVDEFHNVVTDTFTSMLSESRKYGLGVHLTNQYFAQLPKTTQDAILGNVGTLLAFEIGVEDAELLAKEFGDFTKDDFLALPRFNFFVKLMIQGKTSTGFSGISLAPAGITTRALDSIITYNHLAFAEPRLLVEEKIKTYLQ